MNATEIQSRTRMHSSRMRTGRSLTVCWRLLLGGGCLLPGGGLLQGWGVSAPRGVSGPRGGVWSRWGVWSQGGVCSGGLLLGGSGPGGWYPSMHWGRHPPPPWTESQMPVKTLPWPNFVAAGNYPRCNISCIYILKCTRSPGKTL